MGAAAITRCSDTHDLPSYGVVVREQRFTQFVALAVPDDRMWCGLEIVCSHAVCLLKWWLDCLMWTVQDEEGTTGYLWRHQADSVQDGGEREDSTVTSRRESSTQEEHGWRHVQCQQRRGLSASTPTTADHLRRTNHRYSFHRLRIVTQTPLNTLTFSVYTRVLYLDFTRYTRHRLLLNSLLFTYCSFILTLRRPLLPYVYSCKASCARPG